MQLPIIALMGSLMVVAQAAPAKSTGDTIIDLSAWNTVTFDPNGGYEGNLTKLASRDMNHQCRSATYINQVSDASPWVGDCEQITRNIAGGGQWSVGMGGEHHQLVEYGSCAFGVHGHGDANIAYLGNEDIISTMLISIVYFRWNDKIGSKGEIVCNSVQGMLRGAGMTWEIYHI